jgi:hypothetical protein
LGAYVRLIEDAGGAARLVWASSTPVTQPIPGYPLDEIKNAQVVRRNALAAAVMAEHGIRTNDLYTLVLDRSDLRASDGYHYNDEGYRLMARAVADAGYLAATSIRYGAATPSRRLALPRIAVYWGESLSTFGSRMRQAVARAH